MSLITLLLTVFAMLLLSNFMDTFPGVLWGWLHWPRWLLWGLALCVFAWCTGDQDGV
ncbi:MAG: hypothetical protein AAFQ63_11195 [Cyanobacteria bacterium J06621_11]